MTSPAQPDRLTVSVALCTRNGSRFVREQVRSILAQRPAPLELVVGDDDSSDDTVAIIETALAEARSADTAVQTALIVRRHSPPLGVVGNFADAMAHCRGDLIALSDQDDVWRDDKLARFVPLFAADARLQLAHSDARLVDAAGEPLGLTLLEALEITAAEREGLIAGDAFAVLLRRNLVTGATVVLRRTLLERAAPLPAEWVHDEWLAAVAAAHDPHAVRLVPEPLIDYRPHGANEIGARKPTMADRWAKLREPRDDRAPLLAERTCLLAERLAALDVAPERVAQARAKHGHEARRRDLPRWQPARIPGIVAGVARGRYGRYSRGAIDVLRDLVQPAGRRS
ncbi:MAG: glycosyltransferase [Microcella sp.]|uniref:glycosyltransferase n=1 Tax=Microcella sp. TaxID=1913979 RepID=UPI003314AA3B